MHFVSASRITRTELGLVLVNRTFRMPNLDEVLPTERDSVADKVMPPRRSVTRVLVVDDELAACKLLCIMLGPPDYSCAMASNGKEALVTLQREPFDAVISDLQMPAMSATELLAEVRRRYRHMAFLVLTGVDDVDVGVEAMRSGADDYLVKPLVESVVVASLERALHKQQLEQQVENYRQHLEEMVVECTAQLQ